MSSDGNRTVTMPSARVHVSRAPQPLTGWCDYTTDYFDSWDRAFEHYQLYYANREVEKYTLIVLELDTPSSHENWKGRDIYLRGGNVPLIIYKQSDGFRD